MEFAGLFQGTDYTTLSLPTYPFDKQRYWVEEEQEAKPSQHPPSSQKFSKLHPLVHQNTSNFSQQRFTSIFDGQEIFLADHVVQGKKTLPGVTYLEMAIQAAVVALGSTAQSVAGWVLKNVVWAQPIIVEDSPVKVHIALTPERNNDINYQVYSAKVDSHAPILHSQGVISFIPNTDQPKRVDIAALQSQLYKEQLDARFCYDTFTRIGLVYGPSHQGIEMLHVGPHQVLAKLSLPVCVAQTLQDFILHPSLMDAVLQATLGLSIDELRADSKIRPYLAFALQRLELFRNLPSTVWALIRLSPGSAVQDKIRKIDMDLCDEQGHVCLQIHGFTSRALGEDSDIEQAPRAVEKVGTLLLKPVWRAEKVPSQAQQPEYVRRIAVWIEPESGRQHSLQSTGGDIEQKVLTANGEDIAECFTRYSIELFEDIKVILQAKPKRPVLFQVLVSAQEQQPILAALVALLKTAHSEYSKFIGQLIEIEPDSIPLNLIEECARTPKQVHIRYANGQRWVEYLQEIEELPDQTPIVWKERGVYLLTGGLGGLAQIFTQHIHQHTKNPILVLSGTTETLSSTQQATLDALQQIGVTVSYQKADVTQRAEVEHLIAYIEKEYGRLDGILHTAGLIRDNFIINKTAAEFIQVLGPKVAGLVNLDEVTRHLTLDCFVVFSSMAGVMSNLGQAGYACANAFMDGYAACRNQWVRHGQRHGTTLSIDWPLWASGGMKLQEAVERMMLQNFGIVAMPSDVGTRALQRALALDEPQVMVMTGHLAHLQRTLSLG